jgi:E3 ubiquitin-protein ligase XBAT32/33
MCSIPLLNQPHIGEPSGGNTMPSLCRHPIISFAALPGTSLELPRNSLSLSFCTTCPAVNSDSSAPVAAHLCRTEFQCGRMPPMGSSSFRSLSCQMIPAMKLNPSFCMGSMDTDPLPCKVLLKVRIWLAALGFPGRAIQKSLPCNV